MFAVLFNRLHAFHREMKEPSLSSQGLKSSFLPNLEI